MSATTIAHLLLSLPDALAAYDAPQPVLDRLSRSTICHVSILARHAPPESTPPFNKLNINNAANLKEPRKLLAESPTCPPRAPRAAGRTPGAHAQACPRTTMVFWGAVPVWQPRTRLLLSLPDALAAFSDSPPSPSRTASSAPPYATWLSLPPALESCVVAKHAKAPSPENQSQIAISSADGDRSKGLVCTVQCTSVP
ncbi:hypothetical protein B0H10DRAFT_2436300 [Mycena sp. CBHHK59/15]|nr:hypothetical protein B0H10DRAFT_2436300 [Mycena sp. CBHHK59/15]